MRNHAIRVPAALAALVLLPALAGSTAAALRPTPVWSYEPNHNSARVGYAVSTAGDVNNDGFSDVLVGAPGWSNGQPAEGRVLLFVGGESGPGGTPAWSFESGQSEALLGLAVSCAGDVNGDGNDDVVVGAPDWSWGHYHEGRAYCFLGQPDGLSNTVSWSKEGTSDNARFGHQICPAGDVNGDGYDDVLVAAPYFGVSQPSEGSVYLYLGGPSGLGTSTAWSMEGGQSGAHFGLSISTAGDVNGDGYDDVIIGAPDWNNATNDSGGAWIYLGGPGGLSTQAVFFVEGGFNWRFGERVALMGDTNGDGYSDIAIKGGTGNPSYVYVYHGHPNGTDENPDRIYTDDGNSAFGLGMLTAGDVNGDGLADGIVGDKNDDSGNSGNGPEGAIHLYEGMPSYGLGTIPVTTIFGEEDTPGTSWFGWQAETAGDVNGDGLGDVLVSDPHYDDGTPLEGKVWVYLGRASREPGNADWVAESGQSAAHYGNAVATGDWNGDGFSDLCAAAWFQDHPSTDEGVVYVHNGGPGGLNPSWDWIADGGQGGALFGRSVANAGDVNGDGYDDLLAGAPNRDNPDASEGAVWVYHGSPAGLETTPARRLELNQGGAQVGWSVSSAGDVNGDGYGDVLLGVPRYEREGLTDEGAAFLFLGSPDGLPAMPAWSEYGREAGANFGSSVAHAGDLNRDGLSDVIIGAPGAQAGQEDEGLALTFLGHRDEGLVPSHQLQADLAFAAFGAAVAGAGDVNGDGFSDVLVGAPGYSNPQTQQGAAFVYLGAPGGVAIEAVWSTEGTGAMFRWGETVAPAGDVDNDGYGDILVAAPYYGYANDDEGRAVLYFGSPDGPGGSSDWRLDGGQADAKLGDALAGAGDFNGDGFADVALGATGYSDPYAGEGRVTVYQGNERGLDRPVGQLRADLTTPVALGAITDREDGIVLGTWARTALGRGVVRLQWQASLSGIFEDATIHTDPVAHDTGAPSAENGSGSLARVALEGLGPGEAWRWRLRLRGDSPYFPWNGWHALAGNSLTEAKFRTPPGTSESPEADLAGSGVDQGLRLLQLGPNPFRTGVDLSFALSRAMPVRVTVHDASGRTLHTLAAGLYPPGRWTGRWDGSASSGEPVASGVYFIRLETEGRSRCERIVRIR